MLLFFSLALVLNVSASSAASVNQTNITTPATSLDNMAVNISTFDYAAGSVTTLTDIKSASANTSNTSNLNSTVTANFINKSATNTTEHLI